MPVNRQFSGNTVQTLWGSLTHKQILQLQQWYRKAINIELNIHNHANGIFNRMLSVKKLV